MQAQIDLRGASGAVYRYRLAERGLPATRTSGNFLYVRGAEADPVVVYAGQTDNLMTGAAERWNEAVAQYGATHLFTRLNVSVGARGAELQDLVEELSPVMNEAKSFAGED